MVTLGNNLNVSSGAVTISAPQIAIRAEAVQPGDTPSFGIATGSDGNFGDDPFAASDTPAATIAVPSALTNTPNVSRLTVASYTSSALFQDSNVNVASIIVSFDAADDDGNVVTISGLASPVIFSFLVNDNIDQATCSFYNLISKFMGLYTIHNNPNYFLHVANQWSQEGCSVMGTEGNVIICACDHLSVFASTMVSIYM